MRVSLVWFGLWLLWLVPAAVAQRAAMNMGSKLQTKKSSGNPARRMEGKMTRRRKKKMNTTPSPKRWYLKKRKHLPPSEWAAGTTLVLVYMVLLHMYWLTKKSSKSSRSLSALPSSPPPQVWEDGELCVFCEEFTISPQILQLQGTSELSLTISLLPHFQMISRSTRMVPSLRKRDLKVLTLHLTRSS